MASIFGGRHSMAEMGDLSEAESDTSSIMGETSSTDASGLKPPSPATREQLAKRMESLIQENRVLMVELETYKLRVKTLQEENRALKQASVLIQAKAEQEEEFISNTLLKKIQELKKEKEALALNYEQEEECLTNDLSRKLNQLRQEKAELASTLQQEQESMVGKLLRKIKKLEADTLAKQQHLEQLRREKVELENTLEQEQEALVNRLWKRMDKLESEKQYLQQKLDQPISAPPSPMDTSLSQNSASTSPAPVSHSNSTGTPLPHLQAARPPMIISNAEQSTHLARDISRLRNEVGRLKQQLRSSQHDHTEKMAQFVREEQQIREENLRLQRRLQLEVDRRMQLCRHLSESESSLEMDEERLFNELSAAAANNPAAASSANNASLTGRSRTISSPISCVINRPVSPALSSALNVSVTSPAVLAYGNCPSPLAHRCPSCGTSLPHCNQIQALLAAPSPPPSVMFSGGSSTAAFQPTSAAIAAAAAAAGALNTGGSNASVQRPKIAVPPVQQQPIATNAAAAAASSGASNVNVGGAALPAAAATGDGAEKFLRPANPPTVKTTNTNVSSTANQSANKLPGTSGERNEKTE